MQKLILANPVRFGLKWFVDLPWFSTTEEEILAVYEAAVLTNPEKTSKLAGRVYKYGFSSAYF